MRILAPTLARTPFPPKRPQPHFSSMKRLEILPGRSEPVTQCTWLGRDTHLNVNLGEILATYLPHGGELQFHGVTDGSQVYTALLTLENEGFETKPYRFKGFDLSPTRIKFANQGLIGIHPLSKGLLLGLISPREFDAAFSPIDNPKRQVLDQGPHDVLEDPDTKQPLFEPGSYHWFSVSPKLRNQVVFDTADLRAEAKKPKPGPTVVVLANVLHHLSPAERVQLAQDLWNTLQPGSLVALGDEREINSDLIDLGKVGFTKAKISTRSHQYWVKP